MILQGLVFYLFAAIAVAGSVMVISARNPVHSVLWLVLVFFNAAGLFLLMGAEFLAMVLVVVYVGAVAVLFLFVVMMLDINYVKMRQGFLQYLPFGATIGLILLAELAMVVAGWQFAPEVKAGLPALGKITNTEALGRVLYTDYLYLFQAAGIVLLVAMIGSILLTLRTRTGVRKQRIARQVDRHPADTLEIKKIPSGSGV